MVGTTLGRRILFFNPIGGDAATKLKQDVRMVDHQERLGGKGKNFSASMFEDVVVEGNLNICEGGLENVLLERWESLFEKTVISPMNKSRHLLCEDMQPLQHQLFIDITRISIAPISNGVHKRVRKLGKRPQIVWFCKIYHHPILLQVVLQRVTSQNNPPLGFDVLNEV